MLASKRPVRHRNRRVANKKGKQERAPIDPHQRKVRNRTILALLVLGLVNMYVFVWNDGGFLGGLGSLDAAAMTKKTGPLPPMANPPEHGLWR